MTVLVLGCVFLNAPLGMGIVAGLVLYRIVFVMNVMRVVASRGTAVKTLYAAKTISVGVHPTVHVFGLAIDTDIVTSTLLAAAIFLFLGFRMVARVRGVRTKLQIFWEFLYDQVKDLAESAMGSKGRRFVPIGLTLFLFIFISNSMGSVPLRRWAAVPPVRSCPPPRVT